MPITMGFGVVMIALRASGPRHKPHNHRCFWGVILVEISHFYVQIIVKSGFLYHKFRGMSIDMKNKVDKVINVYFSVALVEETSFLGI